MDKMITNYDVSIIEKNGRNELKICEVVATNKNSKSVKQLVVIEDKKKTT